MKISPARKTALRVLAACRTADAWSDVALREETEKAHLDARDAALATELCSGVLQNQALLDYYIAGFLTGRKHIKPILRDILRLAAYQILFLDRIPDAAAVHEAVEQAKHYAGTCETGFVNAVLRSLSRQKDSLTAPDDYAVRYSHPQRLISLLHESVGERLQPILEADNISPGISAQWNPLRCTRQELLSAWTEEHIIAEPHPWLAGCWLLRGTGNLEYLPSFQKGFFQIQDAAARLSVLAAALLPEMRVLDLCAAPGGKSLAAAICMKNSGSVLACDLHGEKLPQIERAAGRLGIDMIETLKNDGTVYRPDWKDQFDAVIADVPCSGLGVIRKKPDIRYKEPDAALPQLQLAILKNASRYVRPGGILLYSTCTILRRENEDVAETFLAHASDFSLERFSLPEGLTCSVPGMLTLYQGIDCCDGFFLCRMRRAQ